MRLDLWWQGALIGLAIAVPVGPIGLLTIQRTLNQGRAVGLATGLGAATADLVYGSIAAFGMTLISGFLMDNKIWFSLLGGLFLCYLGIRTFMTAPATTAATAQQGGVLRAYASSLFLTLTNPPTILFFLAIFAGLGLASQKNDYQAALSLIVGVFCGSALWWLGLSSGVSLLRTRFNLRTMGMMSKLAGVTIVGFGLFALWSSWQ